MSAQAFLLHQPLRHFGCGALSRGGNLILNHHVNGRMQAYVWQLQSGFAVVLDNGVLPRQPRS